MIRITLFVPLTCLSRPADMMISSQAPRTLKVNEAVASERAAKVNAAGGRAMALVADVMDEEQLVMARDIAMERFGKIDGLVNAAGGSIIPPLYCH
jgi:NAD(P)-dependent dehydrogenase (short-subunit alcohol dehydrogenase family)